MKPNRQPLTIIIPTGNRIDVIEDALKSARWADELLVVDSFSSDGTYELAQSYADRVLRHEYVNSALQKNWIIPQAAHEWVMILDTDERVTATLRAEICAVLQSVPPHAGYRIPRVNHMLGRELRYGGYYPDYQIRLFRRDQARYELREVHAHVLLDGSCGTLQSPLVHYAHRSLDQTIGNLLLLMTSWEAQHRAPQTGDRRLWLDMLLRPPAAFLLRYFRKGAWRDGRHGLVMSLIWAMYVAVTYMKIWEGRLNLPANWWQEEVQPSDG